mmetsp:Transcript_25494/g.54171  ORF Transcript_25494/g.54171 Transcript_25494/m.54171 type:complete len:129 (-) Transcript_25494:189-575(-)
MKMVDCLHGLHPLKQRGHNCIPDERDETLHLQNERSLGNRWPAHSKITKSCVHAPRIINFTLHAPVNARKTQRAIIVMDKCLGKGERGDREATPRKREGAIASQTKEKRHYASRTREALETDAPPFRT